MKQIMFLGRMNSDQEKVAQLLQKMQVALLPKDYTDLDSTARPKIQEKLNFINTPYSYAEPSALARTFLTYGHQAHMLCLTISATDKHCLYNPGIVAVSPHKVIGLVTSLYKQGANVPQAKLWLRLLGCKDIFLLDTATGEGFPALLRYLNS